VSTFLVSVAGYVVSLATIAGLVVLVALGKATYGEAAPLIGALAGGHLVATTSGQANTPTPATTTTATPATPAVTKG
jgi:hypothetical protein